MEMRTAETECRRILAATSISYVVVILDTSIVNVALERLSVAFSAPIESLRVRAQRPQPSSSMTVMRRCTSNTGQPTRSLQSKSEWPGRGFFFDDDVARKRRG